MRPDTEGIHPIANTGNPARLADIVFVHGLGGESHSTWRHNKPGESGHFFWPDELGKELQYCGIWSVGYSAGITKFGNPGMVIGKRGLSVASQLQLVGVGKMRPVVFITHSMGGLVIKALLDGCRQNVDPELEKIAQWTKGIAFCGTPHRGSAFATAAEMLSRLSSLAAQDHLREMRANADGLDLLHGRFLGWLRSNPIKLHCYSEDLALGAPSGVFRRVLNLGKVVTEASAVIDGYPHTGIDADHIGLVKPSGNRSHIYLGMCDFIGTVVPANTPVRFKLT